MAEAENTKKDEFKLDDFWGWLDDVEIVDDEEEST